MQARIPSRSLLRFLSPLFPKTDKNNLTEGILDISGTFLDEDGHPIPLVDVAIEVYINNDTHIGLYNNYFAITETNGAYYCNAISLLPGSYTILVSSQEMSNSARIKVEANDQISATVDLKILPYLILC